MWRRLRHVPRDLLNAVARSVKNWLTLLFVGVTLLGIVLSYVYVVPSLENRLVQQKLDDLRGNSGLVASTISGAISSVSGTTANLDYPAQVIDSQIGARIVVININATDGTATVLGDSRRGQPINTANYPIIRGALQSGHTAVGQTTINGTRYATAAVPLSGFSDIVLVSTPLTDLQHAVESVQRQILRAGGLALVVTLLAGYLASYFIARRLKRIERGAVSIAAGDFSRPVLPGPPDEIGQLASTFNMMGARLRQAFSQIAQEKENVEVLLNDLDEGVIGTTDDGDVAVANPAAATLLGEGLPAGTPLAELLPPDVAQSFAETRADGDDRIVVVEHGSKSLEASIYRVGREAEVRHIVVLRDVTEQVRLDQARRDFIATASHELKTPLFSLSGFMELLDEGDLEPSTEKEFLALMRQQVDRLTELSLSLLDLSQVDAGAVRLEPGDVDLTTLTRAVAAEFRPGAEAREVTIDVAGPDELPTFCDDRRVSQVLRALLDNAVKFSPARGRVVVSLEDGSDDARITVADQGPGIPQGELGRIFERFFRGSDGIRASGTGLGLSIARDMVQLMGGTLSVSSDPGHGARFTVAIPKVQDPA